MADLEQVVNDLNLASQSLQELREKYDGALDLLDNKNTEITGALDSAKSDALQEIQTISDTATSQISQLKDTSLNLVNEAKNTATTEISNKKEEHKQELETKKNEYINEIDAKANEYDIANINAQVQAMVTKTGDETIAGVKTFSSSIVIPNATANNHSLPLGQADGRYGQLAADNTFLGNNTFDNLKVTKDATEAEEAVNLRTLQTKIGEIDYSNFAKKNEDNVFTQKQSGIAGTDNNHFIIKKQLDDGLVTKSTILTSQLDLTVGTGLETTTHFNSLQKALDYAATLKPKGNIRVVITLKSGFILEEQILMKDKNYSFIRIESEDAEVEAKGENAKNTFGIGIAMIYTVNCASSAEFNCIFKMSIAGKEKCPTGFALVNGSVCYMQNGGFKNCKTGFGANVGCRVSLKNCDFSGSTQYGIYSGIDSIVQISSPIMRDCPSSTTLLRVIDNGKIQVDIGIHRRGSNSAKISNITPNDRSSLDGFIYGSATINLDN